MEKLDRPVPGVSIRIGLCVINHDQSTIQSIFNLLDQYQVNQYCNLVIVGHKPIFQDYVNDRQDGISLDRLAGQTFITSSTFKVELVPCHTITPAELWTGIQTLPEGEIIQKSLDIAIKLGMEFEVNAVVFTTFLIGALIDSGFRYDSLKSLLTDWTRCVVDETVYKINGNGEYQVFRNLPFPALAPYPVELEQRKRNLNSTTAELMEIIKRGIESGKEKSNL